MNVNEFAISRNDENARKIGGVGRINATGKYEGRFTRAEAKKSDKGSIGIEFDFKSHDGATASFLAVWRLNGEGVELSGQRIVDALMLLMRAKSMTPCMANVDKWDNDKHEVTKQKCLVYPELMDKDIGLLLQKEHGNHNGKATEKMIIYGAYDIASGKTPKEIIEKKPAGGLAGIVAGLKDKYPKNSGGATPAYHGTHSGARPADDNMPFYIDDIPF